MSTIFYCEGFDENILGTIERKKFSEIIQDLKENNSTSQGDIKLIKGDGDIKYFRAKLSDSDRLLFTSIKHNNEDAFVILEVILNHDYQKSKFLKDKEKIKNIKITDQNNEEVSDTVEIEDTPQVCWLGKFITFSATQENIVKNAEDLPLIVSGSAGSGKTSVALEKFRKIEEKFEEGKVLYITQSENLIKQSKELYEYVYWDETANDFKIGIPDRIEFLSLHEFLEKKAEDIKGKKPIDRNKFFLWFDEICKKGEFKKYIKDGDKIFEEFTAVIAGRNLGKEDYKEKLGDRQAIFSKEERDDIYGLFKEYRKFIEENPEYYDPNLIANKCTEEKVYDAIVVDEVQDLTESTLSLILKSLKDESKDNFLLCGDVNQVIHPSFFSLSKLKSSLHKNAVDKESSVCFLEKNYRNSQQVIELANRVLHLKNYCFASEDKMIANEKEVFFMNSDTENTGNVNLIADDKTEEIAKKVSNSTNWAVLVLNDESKENARKLFNTPLVFNIHEAKGLEFKNVILYKFMSCNDYNEVWNIAKEKTDETKTEKTIGKVRDSYDNKEVNTSRNKNKEDKSLEKYKFYMNALYVGVSRAIDSVYIMDNEKKHNLLKVIKPEKMVSIDIKKEESTPEEWKNMALKLIDQGNIEQAKDIVATKLSNKKEYAEEIISALKAKGYHVESDKDKQASSELKAENRSSQDSSTSESKIPKSEEIQSKKRKQHPKEKKKLEGLKKDVKEENTKKLFLALKDGDLRKANQLIRQGVDVNAIDENSFTPLHLAAQKGLYGVVKILLDNEAEVDVQNSKGDIPLHLAVINGHFDVAQIFLESGVSADVKTRDNFTPLHIAAEKGYEKIVKLLLQHKANVSIKSGHGATPLHLAAKYGHTSITQLLLDNGADIDAKDKNNLTPLRLAAQHGRVGVVEFLLDKGANINSTDKDGSTPLHAAAIGGHDSVATLLLQNGANVNAKSGDSNTPLSLALNFGHSKIIDLLLADPNINVGCIDLKSVSNEKADKRKLIIKKIQDNGLFNKVKEAANEKDTDKLGELLKEIEKLLKSKTEHGFKPSLNYSPDGNDENTTIKIAIKTGNLELLKLLYDYATDDQGLTLLHKAAQDGNEYIVQLLLDSGADVNAKSNKGLTPLHLAAQKDFINLAKLWLKRRNNNADGYDYSALLYSAVGKHRKDIAELLLQRGANVNAKTDEGFTPLHLAVQKGLLDILDFIFKADKDAAKLLLQRRDNAKIDEDFTPLDLAAQENLVGVEDLLLKHGADVNAKTKEGLTPLHLAARKDYAYAVDLLLKHRADVNATNEEGNTPLMLALRQGRSETVDLLLTDPNINVGCVKPNFARDIVKEEKDKAKIFQKSIQDRKLLDRVEKAAKEVDENKVDKLLKDIKDLLKPENKYGFKPSLNYSPDGNDENTTIKIAIEAGGRLLQLLYDYAENNIGTDTEIFKQLKQSIEQEKPQFKLYSSDVSRPSNPGLSIG